ncbi:hypothetical protein NH340_JMT06736 [Sarcoptes scabiei]|nr:hypothetical protein NH340_JMT06736 [Sarcoptes scabiei]
MRIDKQLKILFVCLDGWGHLNSLIGIAEGLLRRGHRCIFALEAAWKGQAKRYDMKFEEVIYTDPNRLEGLGTNEYWIEFMDDFKQVFGLDPLEALKKNETKRHEQFIHILLDVDDEFKSIIADCKPDIILMDSYTTIPAVVKAGIPWVWVTSAQVLSCLPSDNLPPAGTGFSLNGDRREWDEYNKLFMEINEPILRRYYKRLKDEFELDPPTNGLCHWSPYLNIYSYPKALDYLEIRPLPDKWKRFDHFVRTENGIDFRIPDEILHKPLGKLIYVSMGSLGCADTYLMKRLIQFASKSPNRFIFSLGLRAEELQKEQFPPNVWGRKFLPQIQLMPQIDLVVSHGGNNTTIESLYFGKPILITPLFGDQFNNAQRVKEVGVGDRFNAFRCTEKEFCEKIDKLLNDQSIHKRLQTIRNEMRTSNSIENVAKSIEEILIQ